MISSLKGSFPISELRAALGVSRRGYHAGCTRPAAPRLAAISRSILGWSVADSLHATIVTTALQRAMDSGQIVRGAFFHSDRGCQYRAALTRRYLARHDLRQSLSAKGSCDDNAFAESCFASIKSEWLDEGRPFASKQAAKTALFDCLACFYNQKRLPHSLDYRSPQNFLNLYFQSQPAHLN